MSWHFHLLQQQYWCNTKNNTSAKSAHVQSYFPLGWAYTVQILLGLCSSIKTSSTKYPGALTTICYLSHFFLFYLSTDFGCSTHLRSPVTMILLGCTWTLGLALRSHINNAEARPLRFNFTTRPFVPNEAAVFSINSRDRNWDWFAQVSSSLFAVIFFFSAGHSRLRSAPKGRPSSLQLLGSDFVWFYWCYVSLADHTIMSTPFTGHLPQTATCCF